MNLAVETWKVPYTCSMCTCAVQRWYPALAPPYWDGNRLTRRNLMLTPCGSGEDCSAAPPSAFYVSTCQHTWTGSPTLCQLGNLPTYLTSGCFYWFHLPPKRDFLTLMVALKTGAPCFYGNAWFNWVSPKQARALPISGEATTPGARPALLLREWSKINQSIFLVELVLDSVWANNVTLAL